MLNLQISPGQYLSDHSYLATIRISHFISLYQDFLSIQLPISLITDYDLQDKIPIYHSYFQEYISLNRCMIYEFNQGYPSMEINDHLVLPTLFTLKCTPRELV